MGRVSDTDLVSQHSNDADEGGLGQGFAFRQEHDHDHDHDVFLKGTWVCTSFPVTTFPTVRSAGMRTEGEGCLRLRERCGARW